MESLTCDLFAPGMTPLHRAGLGGLVSTLRWIEKSLPEAERPLGQWIVDERSVILSWEEAEEAKPFFDRLFNLAFQIQEGLIYLPGQYGELAPPLEVRAALHEGLLLSFYDHGPTSRGSETAIENTYEIDDKLVSYRYLPLSWYKHQNTQGRGKGKDGSTLMVDSLTAQVGLTSALFPGAIQRHAAHSASQVTQSAELVLPLLFAPVGTMALKAGGKKVNDRGNRKFKPGAALLIPDLNTLSEVEYFLPTIIPRSARDCQIANVADAALQAEIRLRSRNLLDRETLSGLRCVWCCPTDWNSRLQPPSAVTEVSVDTTDIVLDQFEVAMAVLAPSSPRQNKEGEYFWPKSYVRPFIAENLVSGRPWYAGFTRLMTAKDESMKKPKPIRDALKFERGGLHTMTEEIQWDHPGEEIIVRAVHEAMRCRYGRIAAENTQNEVTMKNRMNREYERQRLAFLGAKTANALRHALADLWSRAGSNSVLRESWPHVLPLLSNEKWQLTRDLALIALASYQGKEQENIDLTQAEESEETEE